MPRHPLLGVRSEEHTSELQSHVNLVCRLLLEKKKKGACPDPVRLRRRLRQFGLEHVLHSSGRLIAFQVDCHCFFFNDTATTEIYTLSLHDALPTYLSWA